MAGFRFNDLRDQSITELAEAGIPDAAMQSIAGHMSPKMLERYSHVRMAAKREAVQTLGGGLIEASVSADQARGKANRSACPDQLCRKSCHKADGYPSESV